MLPINISLQSEQIRQSAIESTGSTTIAYQHDISSSEHLLSSEYPGPYDFCRCCSLWTAGLYTLAGIQSAFCYARIQAYGLHAPASTSHINVQPGAETGATYTTPDSHTPEFKPPHQARGKFCPYYTRTSQVVCFVYVVSANNGLSFPTRLCCTIFIYTGATTSYV